jgi:adenylate cyclase
MGNFETAIAECETAVELNPNFAIAHHELGFVLRHAGRPADAILCFDQAIRLSPNDPFRWNFFVVKGAALVQLEEYENAIVNLKNAARLRPAAFWPHLLLATALVGLGRMEEARAAVGEALSRKPDCTLGFVSQVAKHLPRDYSKRLLGNLRKAGLPK